MGKPQKTPKNHDRKLKVICLENRNCSKSKWLETRVNIYDGTMRNHQNKIGFTEKKSQTKNNSKI